VSTPHSGTDVSLPHSGIGVAYGTVVLVCIGVAAPASPMCHHRGSICSCKTIHPTISPVWCCCSQPAASSPKGTQVHPRSGHGVTSPHKGIGVSIPHSGVGVSGIGVRLPQKQQIGVGIGVSLPHSGNDLRVPHSGMVGVSLPYSCVGVRLPHSGTGVSVPHRGIGVSYHPVVLV